MLTWTLLQEVPETRQCWENYPARKTGSEETLSKVRGCSPTAAVGAQTRCGAGTWLQRKGSTRLPAPWARVCSERGDSRKEPPGDPAGLQQPPQRFLGELLDFVPEQPVQHASLWPGLPHAPASRPTHMPSGSRSHVRWGARAVP